MFLLSSAATCRIGFQLGNARHRNTVGSLEKHEPEWRFWQPLSLSQSFTFPSSLLLLVSLPFLAYSASPRAKSWALVSSPLHPSPQRLCWISARSRSAQSCRRERERRLWKEEKEERGKKEREAERNSETGKKEEMDTKKKREVSDTPVDLRRRFVLFILHRSFFCREQKDWITEAYLPSAGLKLFYNQIAAFWKNCTTCCQQTTSADSYLLLKFVTPYLFSKHWQTAWAKWSECPHDSKLTDQRENKTKNHRKGKSSLPLVVSSSLTVQSENYNLFTQFHWNVRLLWSNTCQK